MQLTLIRHGVTAWNAEGRWQGHADTPLGELGEAQARALRMRLNAADYDAIYSSDLLRARRTAELALPGAQITTDPALREVHFGDFDARTEAENRTHPDWAAWQAEPWTFAFPGGESFSKVAERALAWANSQPEGANVLAFVHSVFIRALVCAALQVPVTAREGWVFPFPLSIAHASITRLARHHGHWALQTFSDTAHLEGWANGAAVGHAAEIG